MSLLEWKLNLSNYTMELLYITVHYSKYFNKSHVEKKRIIQCRNVPYNFHFPIKSQIRQSQVKAASALIASPSSIHSLRSYLFRHHVLLLQSQFWSVQKILARFQQMYQENMKRREVSPEFHRRRPFEDPVPLRRIVLRLRFSLSEDANLVPPLSTSCSPVTKLNLERSENFGQIWSDV